MKNLITTIEKCELIDKFHFSKSTKNMVVDLFEQGIHPETRVELYSNNTLRYQETGCNWSDFYSFEDNN